MKLLCHPDPVRLEHELVERLSRAQPEGSLSAALVVVPTARLGEHVQRRLAEHRPAWLGLEVLHFRALAFRILDRAGRPIPKLLSPRLGEALALAELRKTPSGIWSRFVERRPGGLGRLVAALQDLREARIEPEAVEALGAGSARDAELADLYRSYVRALTACEQTGRVDEAGLLRLAVPHAASHAASFRSIFLHGAYELIGIHLDLLRALDRTTPVSALLPIEPGARVSAFAESFARTHLVGSGSSLERLDDLPERDLGPLLGRLYDEAAFPVPAAEDRFRFRHAQGAASEVKATVHQALEAVRGGCPANEIAIVARGLAPYATPIEETFAREALPWTSSLRTPLRRHPVAHDLMVLLRALAEDFPRRPTAEALRSPRIRWRSLVGGDRPPRGDLADRLSRKAGIIGGLEEWVEDLPAWAARPARSSEGETPEERVRVEERARNLAADAGRIGDALRALAGRVDPERRRSFSEHARTVESLIDCLIEPDDSSAPALDALRGLLDEMRELETVAGERDPVSFATMLAWLDKAVGESQLSIERSDTGGIRVLDVMQLRGITVRRLFLMGMNAGRFPNPTREDPVLGDGLRLRLRERTGRPLPVKSESIREEHLLLGLSLGSARERIDISWQRADEAGRAKSASVALREIARVARGRPDPAAVTTGAHHVPSHPLHQLEDLAADQGLLSPAEERLLVALRSRGPSPSLDRWFEELAPGLRMLRATESFESVAPEYDGRVGPAAHGREVYSVSALEMLGRCPLQYFFSEVLGVRELDDEASAFATDARELGSRIHALLQAVYRELIAAGRLPAPKDSAEEIERQALELLERAWHEVMGEAFGRSRRRLPALWNLMRDRWIGSLAAFLGEDLARVRRHASDSLILEHPIEGTLELGEGKRIRVRGRFDRYAPGAAPVVTDYKTGNTGDMADLNAMLRGARLQVPLYWLLAGPLSRIEILGVGPRHDGEDTDDRYPVFTGFRTGGQHDGLLETLRVLVSLADLGSFPLRPDVQCSFCAYSLACRRTHPPTLERERVAADSRDFNDLQKKNQSKAPTLSLVRRPHGSAVEPEP